MGVNFWDVLPQVSIKPRTKKPETAPRPLDTMKMLTEIGENVSALNTDKMQANKMKPLFKDFDPEKITPANLDKVGKTLFAYGLVDNLTAELFGRAANEFDANGKPAKPDEEFDALLFFARQLDSMNINSLRGDKYATMLKPDYIRAVHVMRRLHDFVSKGDTYDVQEQKRREDKGELKKIEPMKPKIF